MPSAVGRRFLTTVLFVDVVGSTAIASELGDARWRELLVRFRRIVRAELRRHGGRERDTAGDGFFATFAQPAQAIRAAAAIAAAAQEIGLDVRSGLHTGECEEIDGGLGGIAVHIGSRVIGLAEAAEILTTQTVKEIVAGSGVEFAERGSHSLKGVEGSWRIFDVRKIDGAPLPAPLSPADAAGRLDAVSAAASPGRFGRKRLVAAAVAVALVAAVAALVLAQRGGGGGKGAVIDKPGPISLVRLDARTGAVRTMIRDTVHGSKETSSLTAVNGTLWQLANPAAPVLVERTMTTGAIKKMITIPLSPVGLAFGYGSIWILESTVVLSGPHAGAAAGRLTRIDELSGRRLASITMAGHVDFGTVAVGNGAVSVLEADGTLVRVDPSQNRITGRYKTGAVETTTLIPLEGYDWICECIVNKVLRFDPRTHRSTTFKIAEQAYLVGVQTFDTPGSLSTLWLLDPTSGTLTSMDPRTGETRVPLGLGGDPQQAVIADGSVWAAAGRVVDRVSLQSHSRTTITLPAGVDATTITADPATDSIWLGTSRP
jgi:class 3 adenylate cyclase